MLLSYVAINIFRVGSIIRVQFSRWQLFGGTYQQLIILRSNSLSANCPRAISGGQFPGQQFSEGNYLGGNCPGGNCPVPVVNFKIILFVIFFDVFFSFALIQNSKIIIYYIKPWTEAGIQGCSQEKVFGKYAANFQENDQAEV